MATRQPLVRLPTGRLSELPAGDQLPAASFGATLAAIAALSASADGQVLVRHGGALGFEALLPTDIPALDAGKITTGTFDTARLPSGLWLDGGTTGSNSDWNNYTGNRTRRVGQAAWSGGLNQPEAAYTYGTLATFQSGNSATQLYVPHNNGSAVSAKRPLLRTKWNAADWGVWSALWTDEWIATAPATARTTLGLGAADTPSFSGLTLSGRTALQALYAGTGGQVVSDAGLTVEQAGGIARALMVGNGALAAGASVRANATPGFAAGFGWYLAGTQRWLAAMAATSLNWTLQAYDAAGAYQDTPLEIAPDPGGTLTVRRPANFTAALTAQSLEASRNDGGHHLALYAPGSGVGTLVQAVFQAQTANATRASYAAVVGTVRQNTNLAQAGALVLQAAKAGALTSYLRAGDIGYQVGGAAGEAQEGVQVGQGNLWLGSYATSANTALILDSSATGNVKEIQWRHAYVPRLMLRMQISSFDGLEFISRNDDGTLRDAILKLPRDASVAATLNRALKVVALQGTSVSDEVPIGNTAGVLLFNSSAGTSGARFKVAHAQSGAYLYRWLDAANAVAMSLAPGGALTVAGYASLQLARIGNWSQGADIALFSRQSFDGAAWSGLAINANGRVYLNTQAGQALTFQQNGGAGDLATFADAGIALNRATSIAGDLTLSAASQYGVLSGHYYHHFLWTDTYGHNFIHLYPREPGALISVTELRTWSGSGIVPLILCGDGKMSWAGECAFASVVQASAFRTSDGVVRLDGAGNATLGAAALSGDLTIGNGTGASLLPGHYYHNFFTLQDGLQSCFVHFYPTSGVGATASQVKFRVWTGAGMRELILRGDGAMSWAGSFSAAGDLTAGGLAGAGSRALLVDDGGKLYAVDAGTFRWTIAAEGNLGVPAQSGYLLASTTGGSRSWVAPYAHPATHAWQVFDPRKSLTDFNSADVGFWIAPGGNTVANRPSDWCNVVHFGNGQNAFQLAANYDNGSLRLYARRRWDTGEQWSSWAALWHTHNLGFGTGNGDMARGDHVHDDRYVALAGNSARTLTSTAWVVGATLGFAAVLRNTSGANVTYATWAAQIVESAAGLHEGALRFECADGWDGSLALAGRFFSRRRVLGMNATNVLTRGLSLGESISGGFNLYYCNESDSATTYLILSYGDTGRALQISDQNLCYVKTPSVTAPGNPSTPSGWTTLIVGGLQRKIPYYT